MKYFLLPLCLFCFGLNWIHASIQYSNFTKLDQQHLPIEDTSIYVCIDTSKQLQIEQIVERRFTPNNALVPNYGFIDANVWLMFSIENLTPLQQTCFLEIKNPNIDRVSLYSKDSNHFHLIGKSGDNMPYGERSIIHRNLQFKLLLPAQTTITYYAKVENRGEQLFVPLTLWKEEGLHWRDYKEQYLFGLYYGIICFVFFLNLFIYLIIKEEANLYYLLYVIGLALLQLALGGHAYEFIWPNNVFWANHCLPFLASISVFFLLKFTRSFLNTKTLLTRVDIILVSIQYLVLIIALIALIDHPTFLKLSIIAINFTTLLLNVMIIPVAVLALLKKFKPARFFLVAFVVLILGVFGFILRNFGLFPSNFYTDYGIQIGSALEVVLLSFAIVDKFKMFKDEAVHRLQEMNTLKNKQNELLEEQVIERTDEINKQKEELSEKNKDILDSIRYAKKIQEAILPSDELVSAIINDSFIFYKPKDIVSGDFYWVEKKKEVVLFAVVDCTGHGVPGAFVSIVGKNGLSRAVNELDFLNPANILDQLNMYVTKTFQQNSDGESSIKDGMDIALCALNTKTNTLEYAGAHNPLIIVRNKELIETKADKQPIGPYDFPSHAFTNHSVQLHKNDMIYLFSDGYADQFGGPLGKKYKSKQLKELLVSISDQPLNRQKNALYDTMKKWRGDVEQLDDMCIMGVKIT